MRRTFLALVVMAALIWPARAGAWTKPRGACADPSYRITQALGIEERRHRARRLIRCVFLRFAPEELATARVIATRESGFDPFAWNRASDCRGLFQHKGPYWPARVIAFLRPAQFPNSWPHVSAFNARANAIVTARYVRRNGWGAWSTYHG